VPGQRAEPSKVKTMVGSVLVATCGAVGLVGAIASWVFFTTNQAPVLVGYHLVGWAFAITGLMGWARRPGNRTGPLLVLTGALLWMLSMQGSHLLVLRTAGGLLGSAFAVALIYLVLAFPVGYLTSRYDRALVVATVLIVALEDIGVSLLRMASAHEIATSLYRVQSALVIVTAAGMIAPRLIRRWIAASGPGRRMLGPLVLSTSVWLFAHALVRFVHTFVQPGWIDAAYQPFNQTVMAAIPLTVVFGLSGARARRSRVGDLVVELGRIHSSEGLRPALARTLGDPGLEVGFWSAEQGRYLTVDGLALEPPTDDPRKAATFLESQGHPLAVIVHDAALLDDPRLIDASGVAARLAVENERLHAEVRAQLEAVRASRARIVEAGDAERRRVERNLHDGAQQRLITLTLQLRMLSDALGSGLDARQQELLERARQEASAAHAELRELAQGVHPSVLSDDGLAAALEYLVERAPLPVRLTAPHERYPTSVESTAYFVAAEALTNVLKHARASGASISVTNGEGELVVEVTDDGHGGADPEGSGLRGIADRVAALDGSFKVDSSPEGGTRVRAGIPCE
jgi:signal transduction histidine kinase